MAKQAFFLLLFCAPLLGQKNLGTEIENLVVEAYGKKQFVGLSITIVQKGQNDFSGHYGSKLLASRKLADDATLYEIGSISKVMTRLLLSLDETIDLESPLSQYLPEGTRAPKPGGKEIRIRDLALHTGFRYGVPCVPKKEDPEKAECFGVELESTDPYAKVTRADLYQYVDAYAKMLDWAPAKMFPLPGRHYEYSNAGMGLLGEILAQRQKMTFDRLLRDQVLKPLGMENTSVKFPCTDCAQVASVYQRKNQKEEWKAASYWHLDGMAGAGGVRSNLHDMRLFLKAQMSSEGPLAKGIKRSQARLPDAEKELEEKQEMTLGWPVAIGSHLYHAGQTGASQSMIMVSHDRNLGVVILSNSSDETLHFPDALALCVFQKAGKLKASTDFCKF